MPTSQALADVLDETIHALTRLDLAKLQTLEKRTSALMGLGITCDEETIHSVLSKKRLLKLILQSCETNLNALNRLYGRNKRDPWAR